MLIWHTSTGLSPSTAIRVTDLTAIRYADYAPMFSLGSWRFTTRQKTGNIVKEKVCQNVMIYVFKYKLR